jgi:hypothetical protein
VNLPVLWGAYNHDLAPNERYPGWGCAFSPLRAFRSLSICKVLGFGAVRIWLCEDGEGIRADRSGRPIGVEPRLLESIRTIQDGARLLGQKVYWTLLDGNAWRRNGDELTGRVAAEAAEARRFAEVVAAPIAAELASETTFGLEVMNEPESVSSEVVGPDGIAWEAIVASIREVRDVIHQARPGIAVTCGTQAVFLPGLLADLAAGADAPVDAVDIHVYHADGGLPARQDLPVDISGLPLLAGECGLAEGGGPSGSDALLHYLHNGRKLGYEALFLWKLEGREHLVVRGEVAGAEPGTWGFALTSLGGRVQHLLTTEWPSGPGPSGARPRRASRGAASAARRRRSA